MAPQRRHPVVTYVKLDVKTVRTGFWQGIASFLAFNCGISAEPRDDFWEFCALLNIKDDTLRHFLNNYKLHISSPDKMDDKEFLKFSTLYGFILNVIKYGRIKYGHGEDGLAALIKENYSDISMTTRRSSFSVP